MPLGAAGRDTSNRTSRVLDEPTLKVLLYDCVSVRSFTEKTVGSVLHKGGSVGINATAGKRDVLKHRELLCYEKIVLATKTLDTLYIHALISVNDSDTQTCCFRFGLFNLSVSEATYFPLRCHSRFEISTLDKLVGPKGSIELEVAT